MNKNFLPIVTEGQLLLMRECAAMLMHAALHGRFVPETAAKMRAHAADLAGTVRQIEGRKDARS